MSFKRTSERVSDPQASWERSPRWMEYMNKILSRIEREAGIPNLVEILANTLWKLTLSD